MKTDIQSQLAVSLERRAEGTVDRFALANSPAVAAAWDAASRPSSLPREDRSNGMKFWLKDADNRLISELRSRAQRMGYNSNRSQIVRAAVHLLKTVPEDKFEALIEAECVADEASGTQR